MKILMTGSSGFIGQHLSERLKDHELYHLRSDLLDHHAVASEVLALKPDQIIHLAARTEVEQSFYEQITFSEVNYVGTVNLIEAAAKIKNLTASAPYFSIIFSGSIVFFFDFDIDSEAPTFTFSDGFFFK